MSELPTEPGQWGKMEPGASLKQFNEWWIKRGLKLAIRKDTRCRDVAKVAYLLGRGNGELGECVWTYDEHHGCYDTACGEYWCFDNDAGLKGNKVNFCQSCGRRVKEASE